LIGISVVFNEELAGGEYIRFYQMYSAIQPQIKMIILSSKRWPHLGGQLFQSVTRFTPKPINIGLVERAARELLDVQDI